MKVRANPFKTKVCVTVSNNAASKRPVSFVINKFLLTVFCIVFVGTAVTGTYAGISAYLMVDRLSADLAEQKARQSLALAAAGSVSLPAPSREAEDAVVASDEDMPALGYDEAADGSSEESKRLTDPWLTVEAAPVAENIEYENGDINGRVELIDWFNGGSELFSKGTEVTVIDVDTGLSFHARRFAGKYHADSDPLTADDTAVLKQIAGGKWSWDRHAIWVKIGERYIAASMHCMPHMTDPSPDNDFPGHFCIHFLHSKVHETGKECPIHQSMVLKAFLNADRLDEYIKENHYE